MRRVQFSLPRPSFQTQLSPGISEMPKQLMWGQPPSAVQSSAARQLLSRAAAYDSTRFPSIFVAVLSSLHTCRQNPLRRYEIFLNGERVVPDSQPTIRQGVTLTHASSYNHSGMTAVRDAAQQTQFASARVLAALPGVSAPLSRQPAFAPASQPLR